MELALFLLLWVSSVAVAQIDCEAQFATNEQDHRLQEAAAELNRLDLKHINKTFDEGRIQTHFTKHAFPWQRNVAWTYHHGQVQLLVRYLDWSDIHEKHEAAYDLGLALYEIEKRFAEQDPEVLAAERERLDVLLEGKRRFPWGKSLLAAGILAQAIWFTPYPGRVVDYVEKTWPPWQQSQIKELPEWQRQLLSQKERIAVQLKDEKGKVYPDVERIDQLSAEYDSLIREYPFLSDGGVPAAGPEPQQEFPNE